MNNSIKNTLIDLGICEGESIYEFFPTVRDRNDISVMKCEKSGVLFLSKTNHMNIEHYTNKENLQDCSGLTRKQALSRNFSDDKRRSEQLESIVTERDWLDIGAGVGGVLDLLSPFAKSICAIEPQKTARETLINTGYDVFSSIDELTNKQFDLITLFHVFEHITDPLDILAKIKKLLRPGGRLVIEVPHANDFLISFLDLEEFKKFTFWSEHLILHTRPSLNAMLQHAGFKNIVTTGVQRYPLANHMYWLKHKKPGGHITWDFMSNPELDNAYENMLQSLDMNDTILSFSEV